MSDRVVIVDIRRGPNFVDRVDLSQMGGRAGRSHNGTMREAFVDVVVSEEDSSLASDMLSSLDNHPVDSVLDSAESIAFHILPDIYNGVIQNMDDARDWMSKTFFCFMGGDPDIVEDAVELLVEDEALKIGRDKQFFVTLQGSISATLYFAASDVMAWRMNFEEIFDRGVEDTDVGVAWALSSVPGQIRHIGSSDSKFAVEEFRDQASAYGLKVMDGTAGVGACWWWLMGGPSVKGMKAEAYSLRKDFGRIKLALDGIDKACGWEQKDFLRCLDVRIMRRVPAEIAPLFQVEGISKEVAFELYNIGIGSLEELNEKKFLVEASDNERLIRAVNRFFGSVS